MKRAHIPPLSAHRGIAKTCDLISRYFYWSGLTKDAKSFVLSCDICKEVKAPSHPLRPLMGKQRIVERPWQRIYKDLLGPHPRSKAGNTHLLVVLDQFSKFVLLHPIKKAIAVNIVPFLELNVFHLFGIPESVLADNGKQYISKMIASLIEKYGIEHITTAIYSPQANASERVNQSILSAIRVEIGNDQTDWSA